MSTFKKLWFTLGGLLFSTFPLILFFLVYYFVHPSTFWEAFALIVLGILTLGCLQVGCIITGILYLIDLWSK